MTEAAPTGFAAVLAAIQNVITRAAELKAEAQNCLHVTEGEIKERRAAAMIKLRQRALLVVPLYVGLYTEAQPTLATLANKDRELMSTVLLVLSGLASQAEQLRSSDSIFRLGAFLEPAYGSPAGTPNLLEQLVTKIEDEEDPRVAEAEEVVDAAVLNPESGWM